jgi:hypothetical protein
MQDLMHPVKKRYALASGTADTLQKNYKKGAKKASSESHQMKGAKVQSQAITVNFPFYMEPDNARWKHDECN